MNTSVTCGGVSALLQRRLIFVTGKGGVGKSTVATALGMLAARRGLRTIVAELASQDRVQRAFDDGDGGREGDGTRGGKTTRGGGAHFRELELTPHLFTISIDPQQAMDEYLRIKTGPVGHTIGSTKVFQAFAMATPGLRELLTMGKVWELAQLERQTRQAPYDLVIVDAPATGHGVGILRTPRTFADIARVGPIARQAGRIAATIADPSFTAVIAVSTAEEMPVNETLALQAALAEDGLDLEAVVVNALYPERFDGDEVGRLTQAMGRTESSLGRGALRAALSEQVRAQTQRQQLRRLLDEIGAPLLELPYLFSEELGPPELELLSHELEAGLP